MQGEKDAQVAVGDTHHPAHAVGHQMAAPDPPSHCARAHAELFRHPTDSEELDRLPPPMCIACT